MKLFQETQRTLAILGIATNQNKINRTAMMIFIVYFIDNILNCVYLCRVVETFSEFTDSVFITSLTTSIPIMFVIFASEWTTVSILITHVGKFIEKS